MDRSVIQVIILFSAITLLGGIGYWARRKVVHYEDMSVAGRTSSAWTIFFGTFAFWGGNTIISIIELAANLGIVAIWFGIARCIMFIVIILVCTGPFRVTAMVTISEFIGRVFQSPVLKALAGANIGLNFCFLLVSAIVGAQAFFVHLLGWSTIPAVIFTVISFMIYTLLAGMYGITYTSVVLTIGQLSALVIVAVWSVYTAGIDNILKLPPSYFEFAPLKDYHIILMWIYSFLNNAFLAQAAIQIVMSCKTVEEGKRGLKYVVISFIPAIILSTIVGLAAKTLYPSIKGILAAPTLAANIPSVILSTLVVLGLYFTALGWGAPLVLSGGTCLANDVYPILKKKAASSKELILVTRIGIVIVTLLAIVFAVAIPFGVEFWVIVGFVARNCGLFPIILAAMFWTLLSKRWAIISSLVGMVTGLGWYVIKYPKFLFDAHPMFVGMICSMTILLIGSLWDHRDSIVLNNKIKYRMSGIILIISSTFVIALAIVFIKWLQEMKLFVPIFTYAYSTLFLGVIFTTQLKGVEPIGEGVIVSDEICKIQLTSDNLNIQQEA